jgi:hypothetical protein
MGLITSVDFCLPRRSFKRKTQEKGTNFNTITTIQQRKKQACLLACIFWNFAVLDLRRSSSFWAMRVGGINDRRFSFSFLGLVCG